MPLTRSLFAWVRSLFAGRPRWVQVVLGVAILLIGWFIILSGTIVTIVADGIGATSRGRSLQPVVRLGIGTVLLFAFVAVLPDSRARDETAEVTTTPSSSIESSPSASPELTPAPTVSPATTVAPTATVTPSPAASSVPTSVSATDPEGDQLNENDEPVDGVDYQDIVATTAEWRDSRLTLSIEAAAAPPKVDPLVEAITFDWFLDTDFDGQPDWLLIVENLDEPPEENVPGWSAGVTRMEDGQTFSGPEFPGTLLVDGSRVVVTLDLDDWSDRVGIAATTEHTVWHGPLDSTTIHDDLPQSQWPEGEDWLVVATP